MTTVETGSIVAIISMAFLVGGMTGFFFAPYWTMGDVGAGLAPALSAPQSTTPAPAKITTPLSPPKIGGEMEAEMEDRMAAYPMSRTAIAAWEKEKAKKGKRRVR